MTAAEDSTMDRAREEAEAALGEIEQARQVTGRLALMFARYRTLSQPTNTECDREDEMGNLTDDILEAVSTLSIMLGSIETETLYAIRRNHAQ